VVESCDTLQRRLFWRACLKVVIVDYNYLVALLAKSRFCSYFHYKEGHALLSFCLSMCQQC